MIPRGSSAVAIALAIAGCSGSSWPEGGVATSQSVQPLNAVARLKIFPLVKAKSFDEDQVPDGLEVMVQALDPMGDWLKVWGTFRIELYAYRMASADRHGPLIQHWEQSIAGYHDQAEFWDRISEAYRFQLGWQAAPLEPRRKYLLEVHFIPIQGHRPEPEQFAFDFDPDLEALRSTARPENPPGPLP